MFRKIFLSFLLLFFTQTLSFGAEVKEGIDDILNSFDFDRDSVVSISIKDKNTGTIYEKNPYKALNPASTLKVFTMASVIGTLGENYTFDTAFYKDSKGSLYLKLSGDPLLKEENLRELVRSLKNNYKRKINKIYIDDSIIGFEPYPKGWMEDDIWPYETKISPYMVDKNKVKIDIFVDEDENIRIIQNDSYKFSFLNKLKIGKETDINFVRDYEFNVVDVEGYISKSELNIVLPVTNPKYYFCQKLAKIMKEEGLTYNKPFYFKQVPDNSTVIAKYQRPIYYMVRQILQDSDNIAAETIFRVAGGKYAKENNKGERANSNSSFGTTNNAIEMFYDYFKNLGIDTTSVSIVDGSGVSRYNSIDVDWMTNAIIKIPFDIEKYLPTTGEGTLSKRLREMKGMGYFKTGTLKGLSSLLGVIKTDNGEYYYASIIMSMKRSNSLLKGVEDDIIYEIYRVNKNENN